MSTITAWLRTLAKPVSDKTEFACWIGARNADPNQGPDWCRACCAKEMDRLNAAHPDHEYFIDGGWNSTADYPAACEACGLTLDNSLTEHGVEYALDHFMDTRIRLRGPAQAETAFSLLLVIESAGEQSEHWGRNRACMPKLLRRLKAIHSRAIVAVQA